METGRTRRCHLVHLPTERQNQQQPRHSSRPPLDNNASTTSHTTSPAYSIHCLKRDFWMSRLSNSAIFTHCYLFYLLWALRTDYYFFATPFYGLKTYGIWPDFSSSGWRTQFLSNSQQYFTVRNGFFLPFSSPFFYTTQLLLIQLLHQPFWVFPPSAYLHFSFYLLRQWK